MGKQRKTSQQRVKKEKLTENLQLHGGWEGDKE